MSKRILGIEIGESLIKLLEVSKMGNYTKIHQFSVLLTPMNSVSDGKIQDFDLLQRVILEELRHKKYKAKKVVMIMQSSQIILRQVLMEKLTERAISQWLEVKIDDFLPIKRMDYQIDYKVIEEVRHEQTVKNKILLVATPHSMILSMMQLIKEIHCIPILLTVPAEAISHLCFCEPLIDLKKKQNVMVMDIGGKTTTLTVLSKRGDVLSRVIPYGIENIERPTFFGKSYDEVYREEYVNDVICPQLKFNVLKEIDHIIEFYERHFNCKSVEKIYLMGGGSKIKGLRSYIRDELGRPTEILNQLDTILVAPGIDFEKYIELFMNLLGGIKGV